METTHQGDISGSRSLIAYTSYHEYLSIIESQWPEARFPGLMLRIALDHPRRWSATSVIDVSKDGSLNRQEFPRADSQPEVEHSVLKFKTAIENKAEDIKTRIIVAENDEGLTTSFIDPVGLTFDVEPIFFLSIIEGQERGIHSFHRNGRGDSVPPLWNTQVKLEMTGKARLLNLGSGRCAQVIQNSSISGAETNITIGKHTCSIQVGRDQREPRLINRQVLIVTISTTRQSEYISDIRGRPHIYMEPSRIENMPERNIDEGSFYYESINRYPREFLLEANKNPFCYLFPLVHCAIAIFQSSVEQSRDEYYGWLREQGSSIDSFARRLTEEIDESETWFESTMDFVSLDILVREHDQVGREAKLLIDRYRRVVNSARRLEGRIRIEQQVQVGRWSLQDSRQSIEDGKRLKTLTVLATIFIPISVATSAFGMNIHEMNGSGPRIYVFFIAIIIISGLAITAWRMTSLSLEWHRRWQSHEHEGVSIMNRLNAVRWLVCNRHTAWMIKHGVLQSLMTDGRVPLKSDISNLLNSPVAFLAAEFCQSTTVFDYIEVNQKQ